MKSIFKTVLIDDEPLAIKRLNRLLESHNDTIEIVGTAANGEEGLQLVNKLRPDLIFLDIEMPIMTGFDMLGLLNYQPKIIFTTAFDNYAIKAFEENSVDYLLKPIEQDRLDKALEKLNRLGSQNVDSDQLQKMFATLQPKKNFKSFPVKVGDKILLIKPEEITYLEARDKYVFIVTETNKEYITDFSLTALEEKLPEPFLRVHRAFIINCDKIKEVHKGFSGSFIIGMTDKNQTKINSGRSYHEQVKRILEL